MCGTQQGLNGCMFLLSLLPSLLPLGTEPGSHTEQQSLWARFLLSQTVGPVRVRSEPLIISSLKWDS